MELWNEYEGRSIDGLFPLERLIRPEGRSAFFTTSSAGASTVIRLIESHFDEDEILARWTGVSDLHQPNLLTLTRFGQAMMDGTSLVYAVMEPTEADLSQILCERPLTLTETREVAGSLIPALQALHAKGFVHEHIQAINVLAVGEVVKLRSDCIREAPEGADGNALRARDVKDLASLLLYALTQQRSQSASAAGPVLPVPFREIITNGISGTWGLAQMAAALEATAPQHPITVATTSAAASPDAVISELHRRPAPIATSQVAHRTIDEIPRNAVDPALHRYPETPGRVRVPIREQSVTPRLLMVAVAVLVLIAFGVYALLHHQPSSAASETAQTQPLPEPTSSAATPAPAAPAPAVASPAPRNAIGESWRVVAYTYNRQDQAAAKARTLNGRYGSLRPTVFSPTGRAPFLVTLGGPLSREAAFALRDRLRRSGLPRDMYAQNYSGRSH